MADIGIFYGSTGGHTEKAAKAIAKALEGKHEILISSVAGLSVDDLLARDNLILGSSTWGNGELQTDWREIYSEMDEADFADKIVALFGTGNSAKHGETFVSALGLLHDKLAARGAKVVGFTDAADYNFASSPSMRDGKFVGLPLDETNEPNKTPERLRAWIAAIESSFK
ncbi:MAG: flavodoxin [Helicobacteraceae bacterium]|jgi:flavodoxin I|nr:flavodoxin [Helicobacteraceae bacterium]